MRQKILDTSVLIHQWGRKGGRAGLEINPADIKRGAAELSQMHGRVAIVTPVYLEFLCGVRNAVELRRAENYLSEFAVADHGSILSADWMEADRIAWRVPRSGKPRQLGDCLIRAIANRLRMAVVSYDRGLPG